MLARLVTAIGAVAASVGLTVYGMATSYANYHQDLGRLGVVLMVVGVIATVIGALWYRSEERAAEAMIAARERR